MNRFRRTSGRRAAPPGTSEPSAARHNPAGRTRPDRDNFAGRFIQVLASRRDRGRRPEPVPLSPLMPPDESARDRDLLASVRGPVAGSCAPQALGSVLVSFAAVHGGSRMTAGPAVRLVRNTGGRW
jgi:hypothetical protein